MNAAARPARSGSLLALVALMLIAQAHAARAARIFIGSWGESPDSGRVYEYDRGLSWNEISPPGGLGREVWDLAWIDGDLYAAVGIAGDAGALFSWDGTGWTDRGDFAGPLTSVESIGDDIYVTTRQGELHRLSGATWTLVGNVSSIARALASSAHEGRPMLFMGEDFFDEFWAYDPEQLLACGAACPTASPGICPAGCYFGSCIYSMAEHDDGTGPKIYAGAFRGETYRWSPSGANVFEPFVSAGLAGVQALASWRGRLLIGDTDGHVQSLVAGPPLTTELPPGPDSVSGMVVEPDNDELWVGFGWGPYSSVSRRGDSRVASYDGSTWTPRSDPGVFAKGVIAMLAVPGSLSCDAGPAQVVECTGVTAVQLDGSASRGSSGVVDTLSFTWTGPFVEGSVTGMQPVVHFDGVGGYDVTLSIAEGALTKECSTHVDVVDTTPPVVTPSADPLACLWPPDHGYVDFDVSALAPAIADACSGVARWYFSDCVSSQPDDDVGDGRTGRDCEVSPDGSSLRARAERQGNDPAGRRYCVSVVVVDAEGNASAPAWIGDILVPHDLSEGRCPVMRRARIPGGRIGQSGPPRRPGHR
jgi:hypothetical protein